MAAYIIFVVVSVCDIPQCTSTPAYCPNHIKFITKMGDYHIDHMNDNMEVNNFSYLLYFTDMTQLLIAFCPFSCMMLVFY